MTKSTSRMLAVGVGIFLLLLAALVEGFSFSFNKPKSCSTVSSCPNNKNKDEQICQSRRDSFASMMNNGAAIASVSYVMLSSPTPTKAAGEPDCLKDCINACKIIAPKDPDYCTESCTAYCAQEDRTDGLSGSVSAQNGEVGILGGSFGKGTVPKGEDKPPSIKIPGLDFSAGNGKTLIGY